MDISVMLSTWNNAQCLAITLQVFRQCVVPPNVQWELIVVNNNCTDQTDDVIKTFADLLPIKYVKEPRPGLSQARNTGLKAASGKLIIFTDDDVKPYPDWIKVYWEAYVKSPQGQFWGGPVESDYEGGKKPDDDLLGLAPFSVRGLDFGPVERPLPNEQYFISANWAAPLPLIREMGGFDINRGLNPLSKKLVTGEESDLMDRLRAVGMQGLYLPGARLKHFVPKEKCTLEHILARCEAGALENFDKYNYRLKSVVVFNKPVGMYIHVAYLYFKYVVKRLIGKKFGDAYIKFRIALTISRAIKNNGDHFSSGLVESSK
jgi:glycosyltransferase involved in cell wall biosynthesis